MGKDQSNKFFWKGKRVTERVYNNRVRMTEAGKRLCTIRGRNNQNNFRNTPYPSQELVNTSNQNAQITERRIIDLAHLAKKLVCQQCNGILSLQNIIEEKKCGLASTFNIQCCSCSCVNIVPTDTCHEESGKLKFDVNTRIVMGALDGGMGETHINKLMSSLNIPQITTNVFKKHEHEVGQVAEKLAQESCEKAILLERQLTLKNENKLSELLPDNLQTNFINPSHVNVDDPVSSGLVRIAASYDMGWTTRGNGRDYDSLNGNGFLFGKFGQGCLSWYVCNRKCKKCDLGCPTSEHDCRLNFSGSAKAMEPYAAVKMTIDNDIFKKCNIELGVLIGDDDSSTIAALRASSSHQIVKFSDLNHTSKGVKNELYKIKLKCRNLSKDIINYVHRCFCYAVAQNTGNANEMSKAIKNVPEHVYNKHDNCGEWCGFQKNSTTYKHSIVELQDNTLFSDLKNDKIYQIVGRAINICGRGFPI